MYMKMFMCTTAIQITYKMDNSSYLLIYVKNYYKNTIYIQNIGANSDFIITGF